MTDETSGTAPVPRAIRVAAWAVPLCVLPSAVWRVVAVPRLPDACPGGAGTYLYVVALSAVSVTAAFLTVGLVSPWGRTVPRWVPIVAGRRIEPRLVLAAAGAGIAILAAVYLYAVLNPVFGWREPNDDIPGCPPPDRADGAWLAIAAYAPLVAWLPLLTIVTVDFWRRVRLERAAAARAADLAGAEPAQ